MRRNVAVFLFALLVLVSSAAAQELTGRIEGSVTDPQGAVIPGASVAATHVATNITYRATTSGVGRFSIPAARLGNYEITVESPGFRRAVVRGIVVEVGGTTSVNVPLQVGDLAEEVIVTAEASQELVKTTDAQLGGTVSQQQVLDLPILNRNAAELIVLQAGVFYEKASTGEGNKLLIHGQRHSAVAFSLDGIDTQDNLNRTSTIQVNQPILAITSENVQEFRVATGITSAEYSRGGSQVTAVTRSGTNDFHGSLFWFHFNDFFNANEFFNNQAGVERSKRIRNQFGGRIGGPIWKDKLFFFFGYQQTRDVRGIPVARTVYTDEARRGIFRYLDNLPNSPSNVASNPGLIRQVDLMECSPAIQMALGRFCVDGRFNATNPATFDPTFMSIFTGDIMTGIPLPNDMTGGDGLNTGLFRFNARSNTFEHLPSFRLDYRFTEKHLFYGTINGVDRAILGDFINGRAPIYPAFGSLGDRLTNSYGFSGALISNFTPNTVNEFRVGRVGGENRFTRNQPLDTPFQLDFNDISDPYSVGGGLSSRDNITLHVRDTFTMVKGKHQYKFGGEWRHRSLDNISLAGVVPQYNFDRARNVPGFSETNLRNISRDANGNPAPGTDIETPDFNNSRDQINNYVAALGSAFITYNVADLNSGFGAPGTPERRRYRDRELDLFFQDDWRLRSNLTLNLGMRWEYVTLPIETRGLSLVPEGGQNAVFGISGPGGFHNPGVFAGGSPCPDLRNLPLPPASRSSTAAIALITNCATRLIPGGSNNGIPLFAEDYNNFGPVVGVAWDPFGKGKMSVRAGFRLTYIRDVFSVIDQNLDDNEGFQVNLTCRVVSTTIPCANTPASPFLLRNVVSSGTLMFPPQPTFALPSVRTFLDSDIQDFRTYQEKLGTPHYQEWTLGIQYEFFKNWAVDFRYVGNRGRSLWRVADFNEYNINAFDPVSNMTFLQSFNLAVADFNTCGAVVCTPGTNPLMEALFQSAPSLMSNSDVLDALEFPAPGEFLDEVLFDQTSALSGGGTMRGGVFWDAVLRGRFPVNFFIANPFVVSSRRMVDDSFSDYHALEIEMHRRPVGGFAFQANYTFQKGLADYDGDSSSLLNDVRPSSVINPRFSKKEIIPRQQFVANWVYELPVGQGKAWDPPNGFARRLFGGWQFGGIINWRSGRPDSIFSGIGTFHREAISGENTVNLSTPLSRGALRSLTGRRTDPNTGAIVWLDPCLSFFLSATCFDSKATPGLFVLPNPGELGQLQTQGAIFGPRFFKFDFNLVKRTRITERTDLEFRWEVFNAFNNVNFGLPNTDVFSSSFGRITSTIDDPRLMQFALKLNF